VQTAQSDPGEQGKAVKIHSLKNCGRLCKLHTQPLEPAPFFAMTSKQVLRKLLAQLNLNFEPDMVRVRSQIIASERESTHRRDESFAQFRYI
jgi:predicted RNase H-like nuclease